MARPVIYGAGSWFPIPASVGKLLAVMSHPELVLYLALCAKGRGRARTVTFQNADLMRLAGLTREKTFRQARKALKTKHGLISFQRADRAGTTYDYEIFDQPQEQSTGLAPIGDGTKAGIKVIPRSQLHSVLSPKPTLEGQKHGN